MPEDLFPMWDYFRAAPVKNPISIVPPATNHLIRGQVRTTTQLRAKIPAFHAR